MKGYRIDLLTLLISLFILGACQNPDEIGLEVDPNNNINTSVDENSTVVATTVPEDAISTQALNQYPIGYFNDPYTGLTIAGVAATLNLPSDGLTFGENPVLDSAVLVMRYGTSFYGDSLNSTYRFAVHQLTDQLNSAITYYNNTPIAYNNTELGSVQISKIKLKDSIKISQIVVGKPDTLKKIPPHIRIPIDPNFINTNFLTASTDKFSKASAFISHIKGLYIKASLPNGANAGGIPFFDMTSGDTKLELYYRNVNAKIDTNYIVFNISNNSSKVVANINHDYTGTQVQTQLDNPNTTYTKTFVQALGGLRTKITFPNLDNLKALGKIVINKAVLEVKVEGGTDVPFAPSPRLMLYRTDIAAQRQPLPDLDPYDARNVGLAGFGGFYNSTAKSYQFTVTAYIQDILSGKSKQYAAYLAPAAETLSSVSVAINPAATIANKAVIGSGTNANYPMKLRVTYTKINN